MYCKCEKSWARAMQRAKTEYEWKIEYCMLYDSFVCHNFCRRIFVNRLRVSVNNSFHRLLNVWNHNWKIYNNKKITNEQANKRMKRKLKAIIYSSRVYTVRWCERSVEAEVSKQKKNEEEGIIHSPYINIEYIYIYIDYIHWIKKSEEKKLCSLVYTW